MTGQSHSTSLLFFLFLVDVLRTWGSSGVPPFEVIKPGVSVWMLLGALLVVFDGSVMLLFMLETAPEGDLEQ